ncbi:hypothetical protein V202x_30490 [Gimesia aquarii]|uniref:Uncharacterized protein n=1 Tax=Gimesia aquarii TaxID=2527964 RepID=A0A517WWL9_9PLAN|nr:hypothetical protein V202x_30490 [Gimesia aquarii]
MWCLVFILLRLFFGWWRVCWLSFGNHCKWGGVGNFIICALLSQGWSIRDQLRSDFVASKVNLGTKSSEDWESVFVSPLGILLKPVGFIGLRSAGAETFSIEKTVFAPKWGRSAAAV